MSCIVRNYAGKRVSKDGTVYVYGAGFSNTTKAWLGGVELKQKDYDYGHAEFFARGGAGDYILYVGSSVSDKKEVGPVKICDLTELSLHRPRIPTKDANVDEARDAMLGLLPRGFAWYKGKDGNFARLMAGLAYVVRYIYQLATSYKVAASPSHTDSFDTWESELLLPRYSIGTENETRRREEIFRVNGKKGGVTVPYLKSLLDLYGARYDMYEYWKNSEVFPSWVAENEGELANFYVLIKVYQDHYNGDGFDCTSNCNETLGRPRDSVLESMMSHTKPSHVKIIYSYVVRVLTDMSGNPIVTDDNKMIIV